MRNACLFVFVVFLLLAVNLYCQDQMNEVLALFQAHEEGRRGVKNDVTRIRKINMGIPGGDNWLVELLGRQRGVKISPIIFIFVVNNGEIIQEFNLGLNRDVSEFTQFDIMKDIPGERIGTGSRVVYDYNGDGFDDIFDYGFSGGGVYIYIKGYDSVRREIVNYVDIPFNIVDRENGPAPIEFITYKGMKGFKAYHFQFEVAGGPGWVPDPDPKNGKWFFYAWDEEQREFVEIEEVEEDGIESLWQVSEKRNVEEWVWDPSTPYEPAVKAVEQQEETTTIVETADEGSDQFDIRIAIIAGVVVLAGVIVLLLARKKKNGS